ncbi:MAG TPA: iron ABC transporter permease [Pseudomonas xinjiangensis]|uniref:Iron ABC transporter permease n=2 Tax=root TaxID=1 RepID=A0A7V1BPC8_9GAMM|nr:iron ABC transporter permease [Halopseudomonas xinjiangensis]HEC47308.1 iron ABC transporter permease [Halopseudomonas xinjiangensis]
MMPRVILAMLVLAVTACDNAPPGQSGFAGLGGEAAGFAKVTPGRELVFPQDHGAHPDYRIEWWYVTANLTDQTGKQWGVQWTLFRQALSPQTAEAAADGWASAQVWLGHSAVTHAQGHRHADRLARGGIGQAGVKVEPFEAWIDDWSLRADASGNLDRLAVSAAGEGYRYQLELTSSRPLVQHGEQGFSRKSTGEQASYYYSQPFFEVSGQVEWQGESYKVQGQAWLDREWSSQPLAADQQGWDWFSLHLDSGAKLMLFRLRGDQQHYQSGSWIDPDGVSRSLPTEAIKFEPLDSIKVAGRHVPTRWRLAIPSEQFEITTQALNEQAWMGTAIPYWEGPIQFSGSHTGSGYLEMTGY